METITKPPKVSIVAGTGQVQFDEQRIDAQHGENGEILIKVLHGNGTAGAHQDMAAML